MQVISSDCRDVDIHFASLLRCSFHDHLSSSLVLNRGFIYSGVTTAT